MWDYFVKFYLVLLTFFGLIWLLYFAFRGRRGASIQGVWRGIFIRSSCYILIGLSGLFLLTSGYLTATAALIITSVVLILLEYAIVIATKKTSSRGG